MRSNLVHIYESHPHFGKWCFVTINLQIFLPFGNKLLSSFTWNVSFPCLVTMSSALLHKMELPSKNPPLVLEGVSHTSSEEVERIGKRNLVCPSPHNCCYRTPSPSTSSKGSILGISTKVYWVPILCHTNLLRSWGSLKPFNILPAHTG